MRKGVRRGICAAIGVVMLAGVVPPAVADDEEPKIGEQGGLICEDEPGAHRPFYPGESASQTYDTTFSALGPHQIPYLGTGPDDLAKAWTPQGLAYWPDWDGQGEDLLLVTAYRQDKDGENEPARIHGLDAETGELVGSVAIWKSHVGGIVVLGDYAYVSALKSKSVYHYKLSDLRKGIKKDEPDPDDLDHAPPYLGFADKPTEVYGGVAFLGTDGTRLYAGSYETKGKPALVMNSYTADDEGKLTQDGPTYTPPIRTQGMTVVDGDFYFSVSRTPYSEEPGRRSFIYRVSGDDMAENIWTGPYAPFNKATECYRAPSMSQGMVTHGDTTYLNFESGSAKYEYAEQNRPENPVGVLHVAKLGGDGDDDDGPGGTTTTYTGPREADYHDSFTASGRVSGASGPVTGMYLNFTLGNGGGSQRCRAVTDASGVAKCSLTPSQAPGRTSLTVRFAGGAGHQASSDTVPFTITRQETALRYTGPKRVANGTPARLSGVLTEETADGPPLSGRSVTLALGRGDDRQECTGESDGDGKVACTIDSVDQPLNEDATVPVTVSFDGDTYYEPSTERATVLLEYYTGRSYGLSAEVSVAGLGAGVEPTPDTGKVRTARASTHDPGCAASLGVLPLLRAGTLCPKVVTSLAPGTSRATAAVQDARIGLPGLPLIEVEAATARSTSTCGSGGSSTGSADLRLRVGGRLLDVTGKVNAEINLPGTARLVINEQLPVPGAEHGRTVNAVHLTTAGDTTDIVIASATSDVHNCA